MNNLLRSITHAGLFILGLIFSNSVEAQQFPYASAFAETKDIWNPAFTATGDEASYTMYYRQQWLGIGAKKSPRLIYAGAEFPLSDYNMSLGGAIYSDKAGPITNNSLVLNYAYKLKQLLFRRDQLAFGIKARVSQFGFDPTDEVYREGGDPLLLATRQSAIYPALGGGFSYISNNRPYNGNSFYAGLSFLQAVSTNLLIQNNDFERRTHIYGQIGTKIYNIDSYFEPSVLVNFTAPQILDILLNVKYEMDRKFWAALSYSTINDIFVQGGYIVNDIGSRDGYLRIGALGNINITSTLRGTGPGLELFISYNY